MISPFEYKLIRVIETAALPKQNKLPILNQASSLTTTTTLKYSNTVASIQRDVDELLRYRKISSINFNLANFKQYFTKLVKIKFIHESNSRIAQNFIDAAALVFSWLDDTRDFIFSANGLQLLRTRYFVSSTEPIQFAMLRIAFNFAYDPYTSCNDKRLDKCLDWLHTCYTVISCGFIHVSSTLAEALYVPQELVDSAVINRGEACRLYVMPRTYDYKMILQIQEIQTAITLGVGVGYGVAKCPRQVSTEQRTPYSIRTNFESMARRLDSCSLMGTATRKPKIALYIGVWNDTIIDAIKLKIPKQGPLENVFFGVMIPDYFMRCVEADDDWYLFSGNVTDSDSKSLDDYLSSSDNDTFELAYKRFVEQRLYKHADIRGLELILPMAKRLKARDIYSLLLSSYKQSGSPYLLFSDNLNRFDSTQHLGGPIRTLNLCAEITSFVDEGAPASSCDILSVNFAMLYDFIPDIYRLCDAILPKQRKLPEHLPHSVRYANIIGYIATLMLNRLLDSNDIVNGFAGKREGREIGLSPLGLFDAWQIENVRQPPPKNRMVNEYKEYGVFCANMTEAMYYGACGASRDYCKLTGVTDPRWHNSAFSRGQTQFHLRGFDCPPNGCIPKNRWRTLCERELVMGMANCKLTAQAPTSSTCLLVNSVESCMIPISLEMTKESNNGRNNVINYGTIYRQLNSCYDNEQHKVPSIEEQIIPYDSSKLFVDHSQSLIFFLPNFETNNLHKLIVLLWRAKFKTAIYYVHFQQQNKTLGIIKDSKSICENSLVKNFDSQQQSRCAVDCDACTL